MSLSALRKEGEKSLTLPDLLAGLSDLVEWEAFGSLLSVPVRDLQRIKEENIGVQKRVVYTLHYLVDHVKDLSWKKIIEALEKIPKEKNLAEKLSKTHLQLQAVNSHQMIISLKEEEEFAVTFDEILIMFASLVFNIEKVLKNEVDFDDVLSFATNYLRDRFEPPPVNIRQLFNCLQPYYCFMSYKILKVIVSVFVKEKMQKNMENYRIMLTEWLESTTIKEFKETVEKAAVTEAVDPSPNQCLVVLRLEGEWLKATLNNLWKLLEHLFGKESSILTRLIIKEGSVLVCFFAPRFEILSLLMLCSKKYNELDFLCIRSIQFGNILLSVSYDDWNNPFRLDLNLIGAIKSFNIHKSLSLIKHILDLGADPNKELYQELNALLVATTLNNTEVMSLLVEYGADVHKFIGPVGKSAIHLAAAAGNTEALEFLLRKGVSPDHRLPSINGTPLMLAAFHQKKDIILLLLKNGANPDIQNKNGVSALMGACDNGRYSMAKLLLEKGANPNLRTIDGHTALALSCIKRRKEIVKLLLDFNVDPDIPLFNGFTPLMLACQNEDCNIVKLLLQAGVFVSTQTDSESDNVTAVHIATILNNTQLVSLLLTANADVNIQDAKGSAPVAYACEHRNKEIVECFLKNKANPNVCDEKGKFPLNIAVAKNEIEITEALLNAGADPNVGIGDESKTTHLHYACMHSSDEIVHLLLKANADPNAVNTEGHTPLNIAASMGRIKVAQMLLSEGADIEFEDTRGWTPIFYAAAGGDLDMINFLLKHGAKIKEDKFGGTIENVAAIVGEIEIKGLLQEATKAQTEKKDEATVTKEEERKDEPIADEEVTSTALTTPVEVDSGSSGETTKPSPLINEDDQQSTDNSYSHYQNFLSFISSSIGSIKQQYDNSIKRLEHQMEALRSTVTEQQNLFSMS